MFQHRQIDDGFVIGTVAAHHTPRQVLDSGSDPHVIVIACGHRLRGKVNRLLRRTTKPIERHARRRNRKAREQGRAPRNIDALFVGLRHATRDDVFDFGLLNPCAFDESFQRMRANN